VVIPGRLVLRGRHSALERGEIDGCWGRKRDHGSGCPSPVHTQPAVWPAAIAHSGTTRATRKTLSASSGALAESAITDPSRHKTPSKARACCSVEEKMERSWRIAGVSDKSHERGRTSADLWRTYASVRTRRQATFVSISAVSVSTDFLSPFSSADAFWFSRSTIC